MFQWLSKLISGRRVSHGASRRSREALFQLSLDGGVVTCRRPDGTVERVALADLAAVAIETTDEGPFVADVFWYLFGHQGKGGCVYPGGATGEREILAALQQLPGFDNEAVVRAMGSTDNAVFVCWQAAKN